jgi:hypothetical protein
MVIASVWALLSAAEAGRNYLSPLLSPTAALGAQRETGTYNPPALYRWRPERRGAPWANVLSPRK